MDILGPFPPAKGQVKFLIVAVDHFTKWIEAEAVATITANNIQKFFWKNVITRFGIPYALITDNGLQFTDRHFNEFLTGLGIKHKMTSVEHPQSNGQAEAANKVILKELK
uniref:Pol polyprotein n=1 Tax=Cajanus cajan TaxID=3821 RepID=A0A151T264_CAJCA|nr:Pol polyprotein [Cajanus cajan]